MLYRQQTHHLEDESDGMMWERVREQRKVVHRNEMLTLIEHEIVDKFLRLRMCLESVGENNVGHHRNKPNVWKTFTPSSMPFKPIHAWLSLLVSSSISHRSSMLLVTKTTSFTGCLAVWRCDIRIYNLDDIFFQKRSSVAGGVGLSSQSFATIVWLWLCNHTL